MSDLSERFRTALADRYTIERELGAGGMATVYLAHDVRHDREVAIKVLRQDLAATLGPDRFLREIKIAAQLQHPNILPLLDSGDADGFLYYVMPYVEGQSLRDRLAREGELPVSDVVRILRDVVDALTEAHAHGVVHRDIKPENILLRGRHALVTDFGVAKAVSEATGRQKLTTRGVALGTPAYMAPEQATADPHLDHRVDIYAVGVVAYELLTGRPVFMGTNAQALLASHVTDAPDPVTMHRETVPAALDALIMRCLAKKPADRWQHAEELLPQLEALMTPSGGTTPTGTQPVEPAAPASPPHPRRSVQTAALPVLAAIGTLGVVYVLMLLLGLPGWVVGLAAALMALGLPLMLLTSHHERRRAEAATTGTHIPTPTGLVRHLTWPKALIATAVAFGLLAVGTTGYMAMRALGIGPVGTLVAEGVLRDRGRLLVAEFENRTADSALGFSITEALRIDLQQSPVVRVVGSDALAPVLARMERPRDATIDLALAREIAEREGIPAILAGDVAPLGAGYVLSARVLSSGDGTELLALRETADDETEIIPALDRLSTRIRERIGESFKSLRSSKPLERVSTGSLEALRLYSRGVQAGKTGDYDRAIQLLKQAVTEDTIFAMAYRKLAVLLELAGAPNSRQDEVAGRAFALREHLPPIERYLAEAWYHHEVDYDRTAEIAAYRSVLDLDPEQRVALNNLANVLYAERRWTEVETLVRRALAVSDSTIWQNFQTLTMTQFAAGDTAGAMATLTAFGKKLPAHPQLYYARAGLAGATLDYRAARAYADTMRQVGHGGMRTERDWASITVGSLLAGGQIAEATRVATRLVAAVRESGVTSRALGLEVGGARWTAQVGRKDLATALLDSALARYPLAGMPVADRPYVPLILAYATAGQPDRARNFYAAWEREVPAELRTKASQHLTRGSLALSENQPGTAVQEFQAYYHDVSCLACALYPLGQAYDALGNADSALAVWERGLDRPDPFRMAQDWLWRPVVLIRVGELHEARGETERAAQRYGEFIDLWRDADPELQPIIQDIRQRIARLVSEPRH